MSRPHLPFHVLCVLTLVLLLAGCTGNTSATDVGPVDAPLDHPSLDAALDGPATDGLATDGPLSDGTLFDGMMLDGSPSDGPPGPDLPPSDAGPLCTTCLKIRVGRPLIARGPSADEIDTTFTVIPLPGSGWRGFSANSKTYAIDGAEPYAMGGARTQVLAPGATGSFDECGRWLSYAHKVGTQVHGFVHAEQSCNYAVWQTHKSMAYATSSNDGLSWTMHGPIITGLDTPTAGTITGEGDCSMADGGDGYTYAYCLRASDWKTIVARCPAANPMPGSWTKYYLGQWGQPALGGQASSLGFVGTSAARYTPTGDMFNVALDPWFGGLKLSLAPDRVTFAPVPDPLLVLEDTDWNRPAPTELMAYVSLISPVDGSSQIDGVFYLTYMYLQPGEDFSKRHLVFRDVSVSISPNPISPQVGVALARWYNAALKDRWTTTAAVPGSFASYLYEGTFGYLMTRAHPTLPSTKLEDCVSTWPGHPDRLLTTDGTCASAGYTRLRTAGWVYQTAQPGTIPLYRCYNATAQQHFASNTSSCDGLGTMEWLLGHALAS